MSDRLLQSKIDLLQSDELKHYLSLYVDFLLTKQYEKLKEKKRVPEFGSAKGTFKISADFNEPLDDFYNRKLAFARSNSTHFIQTSYNEIDCCN